LNFQSVFTPRESAGIQLVETTAVGKTGGEEDDMYVITGASGKTGGAAAEKLIERGEKVRVVGRDAKRLERFTQKGAEAFVADVTDLSALEKAFSGAKAVYAMIPPNINAPDVRAYQEQVTDSLAAAIKNSGVGHVVVLSSCGADKPDRVGPVVGLHNLEKKLEAISGLNALFLRAGYFMENLLPQVGVIQSMGIVAGPIRPDLPLTMIATSDIGAAAAEILSKLDFVGKQTRELLGARDVTYSEVAKIVGAAIGKPDLVYKQLTAAQLKPALMQMGMSASMADLLLEMSDSLNSGYMKPHEQRSPRNTTPTTIETFITETFVPAYRGKAARA
jgi:uncharacterized protein YbjT (DUF2867 family)